MIDVAVDISRGMKRGMVISVSNTSIANMTPAIGQLKTAAIPEAAPQARSSTLSLSPKPSCVAMFDPMAEPVMTIGASKPALPPKPTVIPLVIMCEYILFLSTRPDLRTIEKRMLPSPFSIFPLKKILTTITVSRIPMTGNRKYQIRCTETWKKYSEICCIRWTKVFRTIADNAEIIPTSMLAITSIVRLPKWDFCQTVIGRRSLLNTLRNNNYHPAQR